MVFAIQNVWRAIQINSIGRSHILFAFSCVFRQHVIEWMCYQLSIFGATCITPELRTARIFPDLSVNLDTAPYVKYISFMPLRGV